MQKIKALAVLNAISLLIHIGVAYMTQSKALNTLTVGEVSDKYITLFTPASFTFAIWGIIYTCLGIFCLYHIIMAYKHDRVNPANGDLQAIGGLFIVNNLATAGWLIAWTREQLLASVVLIFIQLITLIIMHQRLRIHNRMRPAGSKLCTEFPLSIYLGWISLATIANVSAYLVSVGWDGLGLSAIQWTMIMISVAILIGLWMVLARRNIAFALVIGWGLYGIISRLEVLDDNTQQDIINIAWGGIGLLLLCCLYQLGKGLLYKRPPIPFPEAPHPIK